MSPSPETIHALLTTLSEDVKREAALTRQQLAQLGTDVAVLKDARQQSKDWPARWTGIGAMAAVVVEFVRGHWR